MPKSDTIRSFIAVELDKTLQAGLHQIQEHLQTCHPDVKWVKPDDIHLTLKFLGDVPVTTIQTIIKQLPSFVAGIRPFELILNTVGAFPRIKQPRVIWAGVPEGQAHPILQLAEAIEKGARDLGFEKENKTFTAHVTMGRVRSTKNIKPLAEMLAQCEIPDTLTQTVQSVSLLKSTLKPQGPVYEVLSTTML
ncbi:MAG: RNA 2',3'-cyclic phosphodiesterase [Candidatus Omnitrophota bacterium]|jgi:2'-5' RNA ligase